MKPEKITFIAFLVGLVFKILNLPGSGIILLMTLMILGIIYFPAAFYFFSDKIIKRQNMALSVISGLFFSLIPIGILFKLLNWPGGGQIYLLVGLVTAPIILVTTIFLKKKSEADLNTYYQNMLLRSGALTVLTAIFYFLPDGII